jgi:hypothetical protein
VAFRLLVNCGSQIADFSKIVGMKDYLTHFLVVVLAVFTGLSSVCANLGDSDDKIEDSYGELVERRLRDDGTVSMLYHKDRYLYFVVFDKGRSILETYSHIDGRELSIKEISKFLKANAARAAWTHHDTAKEREFERSDHKAEAAYLKIDGRPTLKVRALNESEPQKDSSR